MAGPAPSISVPQDGLPLRDLDLAYVKRQSAERQAQHWNETLALDPVLGPTSGYVVGVGPRREGLYPLVWVSVVNDEPEN